MKGKVVSIHLAARRREATMSLADVEAVAGRGLRGDRNFADEARAGSEKQADREVTLIELEALEALKRDYGFDLQPGEARRNLVTQGVALNHLVGREFAIGNVRLRGIRLCEPCGHLERLSGKLVRPGLIHRGGLRAQLLSDGIIRVGDEITVRDAATNRRDQPAGPL